MQAMYAIIRAEKHKTVGSLKTREAHTLRTRSTPNADPKKLALNKLLFGRKDYSKHLAEKLEAYGKQNNIRKDGVQAIEYLLTTSPEFFEIRDQTQRAKVLKEWCDAQLEFLKGKHGANNILCAYLHLDEKTPHIEAFVFPVDKTGKLNCKSFLGGAKKLAELQTDYAKANERFGLKRGRAGSPGKHEKVKQFYGAISESSADDNQALKEAVKLDKPTLADMLKMDDYVERQQRKVFANVADFVRAPLYRSKLVPKAEQIIKTQERADIAMAKQKSKHDKELENYKKQLQQQFSVVQQLEELKAENADLKTELQEANEVIQRLRPANSPSVKLQA